MNVPVTTVPSASRHRRLLDLGLVVVLVAVTLWRLWPAVETTRFHRDEARWVGDAALLREWRHPLGERWQDEGYGDVYGTIDERTRRRNQPPLALYLIGAGVLLQRGHLPDNGYWIMTHDTRWNTAQGNMPSAGDLRAGRRTNVAVAALTVVALFLIGTRLTNRAGGMAGALLYSLHPLVQNTSTRAWADPLLVLLIAGAALAAYRLAERPTRGRAVLLSALLGLGGAAKLSPLVVAVAIGGIGLAMLGWSFLRGNGADARWRRLGVGLMAAPLVAWVVFVAVYPYLWTDPVSHTHRLFAFRSESFRMQGENSPDAKVTSRTDAFRRLGLELGERFSTGGLAADELDRRFGFGDWTWLRDLDLLLGIVGWLIIVAIAVRHGPGSPPALMAALIGGQALLVVLAIGVEYARYFLPVLLAVAAGAGVTCGVVWDAVRAARHRPGRPSPAAPGFAPFPPPADSL